MKSNPRCKRVAGPKQRNAAEHWAYLVEINTAPMQAALKPLPIAFRSKFSPAGNAGFYSIIGAFHWHKWRSQALFKRACPRRQMLERFRRDHDRLTR